MRTVEGCTLSLPANIYAVEGRETNIYWANILRSWLPWDQFEFDVTCTKGKQERRRWVYTPQAADAGRVAFTLNVYRHGTLVATESRTVVTKALTAGTGVTRKILCIGDSVTNAKRWLAEVQNLFNFNINSPAAGGGADVMTLTEIGSLSASVNDAEGNARTVYHEGRSGWTVANYYTSVSSPFVFGGAFDFAQYLTANGLTMASADSILVHLGINDLFNLTTDASVRSSCVTMTTQLNAMIVNWRAAVSGVRTLVAVTIPPSIRQDAFGDDYDAGQTVWRYWRNRLLWAEWIIANFGGRTADSIYLLPWNCQIDPEYGFGLTDTAVNARDAITYAKCLDSVHPGASGYDQMADALKATLKSLET